MPTRIVLTAAAIGLVFGGLGIMKIKLVSVTVRMQEIGVYPAIGALVHEPLSRFLV